MQNISLHNFENDITNIREYIKHIDLINKIEVNSRDSTEESLKLFNEHLHGFAKPKKLFEYKAIVISLYGVLESHVGIWIQEHIDTLSRIISSYEDLPEKIHKNHFDLSIKLISLINENKFAKFDHLKKEDILIKLSYCINNPLDYKLNSDAFSPLSGNLKHSKIAEAFKLLDIELVTKLKVNNKFSIFLKEMYGNNISNKGDDLFSTIDDLVVRRNDIAHGMHIDNILNITEFDYYIEFLENYGRAIFETIIEKEIQYKATYLYEKIVNIKGVFKSGSVLCFEIENNNIEIGDYIIIETPEKNFIKKEILGIEENNKPFEKLIITSKINIGVNLGSGISKHQTFYMKKAK